ncbi:MAG: hypothetical protein HUJ76_05605, partial [Parasporobacterium sp.]|nr:hypothetical protein [Parasporobacterium sp.]
YWKAVVGNYFHVEDEAKIAEITECMDAIGAFRQATVHGIVSVPEDYMLKCAKRVEEEVFPNIDRFMELTVKACRLIDEARGK